MKIVTQKLKKLILKINKLNLLLAEKNQIIKSGSLFKQTKITFCLLDLLKLFQL